MPDFIQRVQILINKVDERGISFNDAIYYTQAEFDAKDVTDIQADVDARFQAWKDATAPVIDERTPDQVAQDDRDVIAVQKADAETQLEILSTQLDEAEATLSAVTLQVGGGKLGGADGIVSP